MRRVLALAFLVLVPLVLPSAPAASVFVEDWQSGTDGWTLDPSVTLDCTMGSPRCSLKTAPPCCGGRYAATHALDVPLPASETLVTEFQFYYNLTASGLRPFVELVLDEGSLVLHLNADGDEHVALQTSQGYAPFGGHDRFGWWTIQILVRDHSAMARFPGGTWRGAPESAIIALPEDATRITGLRLGNSMAEDRRETIYWFDNVRLFTTPACLSFTPTLGTLTATAEYPFDPGFSLGVVGGHASCATSWTMDFGDGSGASGIGAVPASLPHTYAAAGTYQARLAVTEAGETRNVTRTIRALECNPLALTLTAPFVQGDAPLDVRVSTTIGSTLERCHASWRLDFGDGSPILTGTAAAPVDVAHTYAEPDVATAVFEVSRGSEYASITRHFTAGPLEQRASGTVLVGAPGAGTIQPFQHHVALDHPADGTDALTLTWSAPVSSDLDVWFTTGGRRVAAPGCTTESTIPVETCAVPRGADGFVVAPRLAVQAEWSALVTYA